MSKEGKTWQTVKKRERRKNEEREREERERREESERKGRVSEETM